MTPVHGSKFRDVSEGGAEIVEVTESAAVSGLNPASSLDDLRGLRRWHRTCSQGGIT